jgi:hypothetical protein
MTTDHRAIALTDDGQARLLDYELADLARSDRGRFELAMLSATDAFLALAAIGRQPSLWETVAATLTDQDGRGPSARERRMPLEDRGSSPARP